MAKELLKQYLTSKDGDSTETAFFIDSHGNISWNCTAIFGELLPGRPLWVIYTLNKDNARKYTAQSFRKITQAYRHALASARQVEPSALDHLSVPQLISEYDEYWESMNGNIFPPVRIEYKLAS